MTGFIKISDTILEAHTTHNINKGERTQTIREYKKTHTNSMVQIEFPPLIPLLTSMSTSIINTVKNQNLTTNTFLKTSHKHNKRKH